MNSNKLFEDLASQAFYFPRAILLTIPMLLAWMFWKDNRKHIRERFTALKKKGWIIAFFIYISYILVSTVMGRAKEYPLGCVTTHLFPGNDIKVWTMNIENMLMFVPYSFLYLKAFRPEKPWKSSLIILAITSLFIESCQLLLWLGVFQLSDILYNIIGGIIGTGIWTLWKKLNREETIFTNNVKDIGENSSEDR